MITNDMKARNWMRALRQVSRKAINLVPASLIGLSAMAAEVTPINDGFEGATLSSFWTSAAQNGSITFPATDRIHAGAQSVRFNATGGGQKELSLSHQFATPQFGTVSTWVYDSGEYIYFSLGLFNTTVGPNQAGIGVQDWDGSCYYYSLFNGTGAKSTVPRTRAWRQFTVRSTVSALTLEVDGLEIYRGPGGQPFDRVVLRTSGPGGGTIWFDDFVFEVAPEPAALRVTSLSGAGRLTWTNLPALTNGLLAIEWAASAGTNWRCSWNGLQAFGVNGASTTVEVPMLYRVKCVTNLFLPIPVGGRFSFIVSNAVGGTGTEQMTCLGLVKPSAGGGKEYALMENVEGGQMRMHLLRSTDAAVYRFDPNTLGEDLEFQVGPPGTTWTNFNYEGQFDLKVTVEAIESVTVPAGTFASCYRYRKEVVGGGPTEYWQEWIAPGIGLVQWVDYWVDPSENPPVTHQLEAMSRPVP